MPLNETPHEKFLRTPLGVTQHNFYTNGVILHACVHGRQKDFFQGATIAFFQKFF